MQWTLDIAGLGDTALNQTLGPSPAAPTVWAGTTTVPEEPGLPLRSIAVAFDTWVAQGPTMLAFTPAEVRPHAVHCSSTQVYPSYPPNLNRSPQ